MIITLDQLIVFLLITGRVSGLFVTAPFLSSRQIFALGKMALIFWVSSLMIFVVPLPEVAPHSQMAFLVAMLIELFIGATIGLVAEFILKGIEFAGNLMDTQAGLSVASLLDPATGQNAALFQILLRWISILIFILLDGHHMLLSVLYQSFQALPIGTPINISGSGLFMFGLAKEIFMIGVQLAAPILLIVFIVDFGFGMLNRVAEQVNIFQLGFQLKPTVSLIIFLAITPGINQHILQLVEQIMEHIVQLFGVFRDIN